MFEKPEGRKEYYVYEHLFHGEWVPIMGAYFSDIRAALFDCFDNNPLVPKENLRVRQGSPTEFEPDAL